MERKEEDKNEFTENWLVRTTSIDAKSMRFILRRGVDIFESNVIFQK